MEVSDEKQQRPRVWIWSVLPLFALIAASVGIFVVDNADTETRDRYVVERPDAATSTEEGPPPQLDWQHAPTQPGAVAPAGKPTLVLLHATWCQWCRVLEHEVLPRPEVARLLEANFELMEVDVDHSPLWLDLPDVDGLPSLVFFDAEGRHVLTKSGYREATDLVVMLDAVLEKLRADQLEPYPGASTNRLAPAPLTTDQARDELERLRHRLLLEINSNNGGFGSPARHPHPDLLLALQSWKDLGGPEPLERWLSKTTQAALRGSSARLDGEPLPDMDFGAEELARLSELGPEAGDRWREGIDRLPAADPYLGIQDPFDHGVFRYAAGPGWYHPHFERRALDNLSWALLLRRRDRREDAGRIAAFVEETFSDAGLLNAVQQSDPFYYRLRAEERRGLPAPNVERLWTLRVQARAARVWPERCEQLLRVPADGWPRARWRQTQQDPNSPEAPPDAVGELLLALAGCEGRAFEERAAELAEIVIERWSDPGLAHSGRLHRLAAGVCAAAPRNCALVLKSVEGLEIDFEHAPPLAALAAAARRQPE